MQRQSRVVSIVEESWGTGTIYNPDSDSQIELGTTTQLVPKLLPDVIPSRSLQQQPSNIVEKEEVEYEEVELVFENTLPFLQASLVATVLEDAIVQLRILVECNTEMRISKTKSDIVLLLALKYGVEQPKIQDELDGIDVRNLGANKYKLNKLDADRKNLEDVLVTTYRCLTLHNSYQPLAENVKKIVDRNNYRVHLAEEEAKNKIIRRDLHRQLRQQRNHIKSVTYDTDVMIDDLKTEVEDSSLNAEMRSRYVEKWQLARSEQHVQSIEDTERTPTEVIEYYKQRSDHEQRAHTEVELLNNIVINETLEKVEKWMDKYDKDIEKVDLKIQIKKNEYQNELDRRINLEEAIERHDKAMKEWLEFKDIREKARQYREKMTNSAVIVQAWWRGLLVRKQLGPYKVAKKRGGKGPKK